MGRWRTRTSTVVTSAVLATIATVPSAALAFTDAGPVDEGGSFPWGASFIGLMAIGFVAGFAYLLWRGPSRDKMPRNTAWLWAFVIFAYFLVATTWFPSWVASQKTVATAEGWISDLVGSGAWLVPFLIGLVALRWLQKAERI